MSEKAAKKAPAKKTSAKKAAAKRRASKAMKKETTEVAEKKTPEVKLLPAPVVLARHERGSQERDARGYSLGELGSAGITFIVAKKAHVPIDIRRRSVLEGNVGKLKEWYVPEPKKEKVETAQTPEKPGKTAKKPVQKAKKSARATKE
jgi:ribosomal protein L13E